MSLAEYLKYMGYDCTITAMARVCRVNKSTLHRKYNKSPVLINELLERYSDKLRG